MSTHLILFAKHWTAGQVKTRLAETVGPAAAAELYRAGLEVLLARLRATADQRTIAYWPPTAHAEFARLAGSAWRLMPQSAGDLGARLAAAFQAAFAAGARRVVSIGSDSPTLRPEWIDRSLDHLAAADLVLGPADDGGYWLIGTRGPQPALFAGMPWSTSELGAATLAAAAHHGLHTVVVERWYDVDERADLDRLAAELPPLLAESPDEWRPLAAATAAALACADG